MQKHVFLDKFVDTSTDFFVVDVINNEKHIIDIFSEIDTINIVMKKIEAITGIDIRYQLLFYPDNRYVITSVSETRLHIPKDISMIGRDNDKDNIVHRYNDLMNEGTKMLYIISLPDFIDEYYPNLEEDNFKIDEVFNQINVFWNKIDINEFNRIIANEESSKAIDKTKFSYEKKFVDNFNSITAKNIKDLVDMDAVNKVSLQIVTYYKNEHDTEYIFDQFEVSLKYHNILYKKSMSEIIRKYYRYKNINYVFNNKIGQIKINSDILIYGNTVIHNDKNIIKRLSTITGNEPIYDIEKHKFMFMVKLHGGVKFNIGRFRKIISGFHNDICEHSLVDVGKKNHYTFYYKKVSLSENVNIDIDEDRNFGANIKISGKDLIMVVIKDVYSLRDMKNIYNFIGRLFVIYMKNSMEYYNSKAKYLFNQIKFMRKIVDPYLYDFNKKILSDLRLYSKRVPKEKHPLVFHEGSEILKKYIKYMKRSGKSVNTLRYKNYTYRNKFNIYLCDNPKYKFFQFRSPSEHPNNICTVSCCVKNKSKTLLYNKCLKGVPFKIESINESVDMSNNNMFYIKRFNRLITPLENKISFLPDVIHKFLNKGTVLINNSLKIGTTGYFMIGSPDDRNFFTTLYSDIPFIKKMKMTEEMKETGLSWNDQWNIINHYYKHNINVVIFEYNVDDDKIMIKNSISDYSLLKSLDKRRSVFILAIKSNERNVVKYTTIFQLKAIKNKKYDSKKVFDSNDIIVKFTKDIVRKLFNNERVNSIKYISCYDLSLAKISFFQIRETKTNIITHILVQNPKGKKYCVIPVLPSLLDINIKYINAEDIDELEKYMGKNTYKNVISIIDKINTKIPKNKKIIIRKILKDMNNYTGIIVNEDYIVRLSKSKSPPVKDKEVVTQYFNKFKVDKHSNDKTDSILKLIKELYYVFVYHIAYFINYIDTSSKKYQNSIKWDRNKWTSELMNIYGKDRSKLSKDYHKMITRKFNKMEFYKTHKLEIIKNINNSPKVGSIIKDLMINNNYVEFIPFKKDINRIVTKKIYRKLCLGKQIKSTILFQCDEDTNSKLLISKIIFDKFVILLSHELKFNKSRFYEVMNNKVQKMNYNHRYNNAISKDTITEIIYLSDVYNMLLDESL